MASEHPEIKANFICGRIEEFLSTVSAGDYDMVLCLSVLHNISKYLGVKKIQDLMADLSQKVSGGIFEFALENVHLSYIPADYRDFLLGFSFIREVSHSKSRDRNGITRPLCFASDKYVWFESLGMLKVDQVSYNVHSYLRKKDLIHFHCGDKFVKFFYVKSQGQLVKAQNEIQFLKKFDGQKGLPHLLALQAEQDHNGIRIFIVRNKLSGVTLSEKISSSENFDRWDVIKQTLEWMVFFEQHGYYNGDIQTSNFIYGKDDKVYPIDYEEIRHEPISFIWPYKVNLLFLIFMNSVLAPEDKFTGFHRKLELLTALKKHLSQDQYEQIASIKDSEKFFARLYEILFQAEAQNYSLASYDMKELECLATEKFLNDVSQRLKENQNVLEQLHSNTTMIANHINNLTRIISDQQKRIEHLERIIMNLTLQKKFTDSAGNVTLHPTGIFCGVETTL